MKSLRPAVLTFALLFPSLSASGQTSDMQAALAAWNTMDFDSAIELFSEVANSSSAAMESRVQSYKYLARLFVAKQMEAEARTSIR